jgi:hypothetical protein
MWQVSNVALGSLKAFSSEDEENNEGGGSLNCNVLEI